MLVGTGPEESNLVDLAKHLGVSDRLDFLSNLTDAELLRCYQEADLFVQPNGEVDGAFEGYGMVFLEAAATGLAVIGGKHGGVPEVVQHGETGLLVPPFNDVSLADMVSFLLENHSLRQRMGKNARELAESRCWENTLASIVDYEANLMAARA